MQDLAKRAKMTKDKDLQALVQENLNKHRELLAKVNWRGIFCLKIPIFLKIMFVSGGFQIH